MDAVELLQSFDLLRQKPQFFEFSVVYLYRTVIKTGRLGVRKGLSRYIEKLEHIVRIVELIDIKQHRSRAVGIVA